MKRTKKSLIGKSTLYESSPSIIRLKKILNRLSREGLKSEKREKKREAMVKIAAKKRNKNRKPSKWVLIFPRLESIESDIRQLKKDTKRLNSKLS